MRKFMWLLLLALPFLPAYGDELLLKNGERVECVIVSEDANRYEVMTSSGRKTFPKEDVKSGTIESNSEVRRLQLENYKLRSDFGELQKINAEIQSDKGLLTRPSAPKPAAAADGGSAKALQEILNRLDRIEAVLAGKPADAAKPKTAANEVKIKSRTFRFDDLPNFRLIGEVENQSDKPVYAVQVTVNFYELVRKDEVVTESLKETRSTLVHLGKRLEPGEAWPFQLYLDSRDVGLSPDKPEPKFRLLVEYEKAE